MTGSDDKTAVLAFDIGGTQLRAALVMGGRVLAERKSASGGLSPEALAARAKELAKELEGVTGEVADRAGVGIAAMLPLPAAVIENAPNLGWHGVPFRRILEEALDGRPAVLVNDVDAIAVGEAAFGAGKGAKHLCAVFAGTGIGAGILVDGSLLTGFRGVAAEIGHVKVVAQGGRPCYCGQIGCLEAYAGGRALLERVEQDLAAGRAEGVRARVGDDTLSLAHVDDAAAQGDPYADALWGEAATYLGMSLANLCTLLNPEVLVLGGGVWSRCPDLRRRVREAIDVYTNEVALVGLKVVDAILGDHAGLLGAAKVALERL